MSALKIAFVSLITSNESWAKQLEKALGNKKFLSEQHIVELGSAVCEKYGCYVDVAENGMYRFYKTEEVSSANIHEGAKKCWQRHVAKYHNIKRSNRGGNTAGVSKQEDLVEKALALVESLSKAQQAVFFRKVTRK